MERLQRLAPAAHFVKCFSSVGNNLMVNPDFGGSRPTMFICGNHSGSNALSRRDQGYPAASQIVAKASMTAGL